MGGVAKSVGKGLTKVVRETTRLVSDVFIKIPAEISLRPVKELGGLIGGDIGNIISESADIGLNGARYIGNAMTKTAAGSMGMLLGQSGAKAEFKESLKQTVQIAFVAAAIVGAIYTMQWYAIPAIIIYADGLVNQGGLTYATISAMGNLEEAIFNSNNINKYKDEIYATVMMISTMVTSYAAFSFVGQMVSPFMPTYVSTALSYAQYAYSGYQVYTAYQTISTANERYKKMYEEWAKRINEYYDSLQRARQIFYDIITSSEMYRYFAGGDIYNSTSPGGSQFAPLTVNEPYAYILSQPKSDRSQYEEINTYSMGRQYEYMAGSESYMYSVNPNMKWG
ncbi:Uncharacterised protein [Campylobacter hyointestinalis subsp. hyointestinalis]|uniref:Uncharacterized protein n=2 Tax=Campylobacter hyointestinalis TaxID=198 RepID=A0A9W5AMN9_CAMHY|nr:Uncharacterised protein [Campylobacter hyointestinalis subsp. hyointestinalis]CUU82334.1 Uncharacterised protein [Campylobacter hyointestinalis subsp. hyointestinalis]